MATDADLRRIAEAADARERDAEGRALKWSQVAHEAQAERDALLERAGRLEEALYSAEAFIVSVTRWDGQQDDQEETLAEVRAVLAGSQQPGGDRG